MPALNNITSTVSSTATKADLKNYIYALHQYLNGLFGSDGVKATAIATLGASPFPAGTAMLFAQASAPTGWTKSTTHNDKALRVVSGTSGGSAAGSVAFSTVFGRTASDASSLSIAQLASHAHDFTDSNDNSGIPYINLSSSAVDNVSYTDSPASGQGTRRAGSGSTHSHGMDLRVQYVDVIIATKD